MLRAMTNDDHPAGSPGRTPAWFLDELAHAGEEHLHPPYVAGYDGKAGIDPDEEVALLRRHGLDARSTLVDLGAGTGTVSLAAAAVCRRVVAVDVSAPMLAQLRDKAGVAGLPHVECVQAGFLSYDHQGDPADMVYVRHALHQIPDFWKVVALRRIAAMLRPGGVLVVRDLFFSCEPDDVPSVVDAWLAGAVTDPSRGWTKEEYETHLRTEHSTFTWLFEEMLRHTGFEVVEAWSAESQVYARYVCRRA
jgi:ubiquinone/menaquinone biosynthesis C-methylase UbiE